MDSVTEQQEADVAGNDGINQHKRMAMGGSIDAKCEAFPAGGAMHPDATSKAGEKELGEHERAVGEGIKRGGSDPMAQQAPDHGPLHRSNVAFSRGGKI